MSAFGMKEKYVSAFNPKNDYPFELEKADSNGNPSIKYDFDSTGRIGRVWVYNLEIDDLVMADLDAFERRQSYRFENAEEEIHHIVNDPTFKAAVKHKL